MKSIAELCKEFDLDAIYCIDFETFWSDEFTLKKLPTTEYICDDRFELQIGAVYDGKRKYAMDAENFQDWAASVDWSRIGVIAHHAHFDMLIASRYCNMKPKMYFDTLSMANVVMPSIQPKNLDALAKRFGFRGKRRGGALVKTKGRHWAEMTPQERKNLLAYAGDDTFDEWGIFLKMLPFISRDELRLIDLTIRMYAQPCLLMDVPMLQQTIIDEAKRRVDLVAAVKVPETALSSGPQFKDLLEKAGIEVPMKVNKKGDKVIPALALGDFAFKQLLGHRKKRVRELVAARIAVKSTIVRTRATRLIHRAQWGPQPVYLKHAGAHTRRWSGSDKSNWQNQNPELKKAVCAPKGYVLVNADLAQIEARLCAWFLDQADLVEAFRRGEDVYVRAAMQIFGCRADQVTKTMRFVGKTAVLSLGYGAGWHRFGMALRTDKRSPIDLPDDQVEGTWRGWRNSNPFIVAGWKKTQNNIRAAFMNSLSIEQYPVTSVGAGGVGFIHGPEGLSMRYDGIQYDEDGLSYIRRIKSGEPQYARLYGGKMVENICQFLARIVIAKQMVDIADELPWWRQSMTAHDAVLGVVPKAKEKAALKAVTHIMSLSPKWAPDLPLKVEANASARYS